MRIEFVDGTKIEDPTTLNTIEEFLESIPYGTIFYESEHSSYLYQKIQIPDFLVQKKEADRETRYVILDLESGEFLEYCFFKWIKPNEMKIVKNCHIVIERPSKG